MSTFDRRRTQNNALNEVVVEPKLLLVTEKKYDWSKKGMINLFAENVCLPSYKLSSESRKVRISWADKGTRY